MNSLVPQATTWVVVPVYGAAAALRRCLHSLLRTLDPDVPILVADDASVEPEVNECLAQFQREAAGRPVRCVRRPRNLGFVGNVNAAFAETGDADVVLLNSDTETTPGWLQAMQRTAASADDIATVTPWSNNAEICSFPDFCQAAPMPETTLATRIARAAGRLPLLPAPELVTGVGFAMYLRRRALNALGDFDQATFGRGYGEENDFCLRAHAHGWRNVLCTQAYVAHQGHASFSDIGVGPGGENLRRLLARYPDYNARVADFIRRDPLRPLRCRLQAELDSDPDAHTGSASR